MTARWATSCILRFGILYGALLVSSVVLAGESIPDWRADARIPAGGRDNPYGVSESVLTQRIHEGRVHTLQYPVTVTGVLVPYAPLRRLLEGSDENPLVKLLRKMVGSFSRIRTTDQLFSWLGLHEFPDQADDGIPFPGLSRPDYRMGFGLIHRQGADGVTFSCAGCHSADLFGRKILGLSNRFPRANEFFLLGKRASQAVPVSLFRSATGANESEVAMYAELKKNSRFVGVRSPQNLGLDTSLAQVALSLARRAPDGYATRELEYARHPRPDDLDVNVADSKPAVWWNVKYKNRWLLDGSVVSGNPIYTNILWNEIGRGADLRELEGWLNENQKTIEELTSAVFASQAPQITEFFPPELIDLNRARRGERLFNERCANCHGVYEKNWSLPGSERMSLSEKLKTATVRYPESTVVIDVGTDPLRYLGMRSLAPGLNQLAISVNQGIRIIPQKGYVPPPLVGIWARWPYFHNNSVPNLFDVLTRSEARPLKYAARAARNKSTDFDLNCNGYPSGIDPGSPPELIYDASRAGMGNRGHDEGIFLQAGRELLSSSQKRDIVVFLQTL